MLTSWQYVWRNGFAKVLSKEGKAALKKALEEDSPELCQERTVVPPPFPCHYFSKVEQCCAVSYCGWRGQNLTNVEEVDQYFAEKCHEVDILLGEPAGCRWFLNWFDDTPREEMRKLLLQELNDVHSA